MGYGSPLISLGDEHRSRAIEARRSAVFERAEGNERQARRLEVIAETYERGARLVDGDVLAASVVSIRRRQQS